MRRIGASTASSWIDRAIAELAKDQHGVVSRGQLVALGLGAKAIRYRLDRGRLHILYRSVYAVGHRDLSAEGWWMAAVLAGGEGAVLSHRSAAALWGVRKTMRAATDVTVGRHRRLRPGLQFHWTQLAPDELTRECGIPVTTVPRTIFDMAAILPPSHVESAINEAEVRRLTDPLSLSDLLSRYPGRRGSRTIRAILAEHELGVGITREELEHRFREFIDQHGLPRPRFNHHIHVGGRLIEADCVWEGQRLIVELDGRATHGTAKAFEDDRARDRALSVAGWRVIRITWRQLHGDPGGLAADLRTLLRISASALGYPVSRR
jgi:very-short-patch-repair endonuclease